MPTRINIVYGKIDGKTNGIVEFNFDDKWESTKSKGKIKIRRKGALKQGDVIPE